MSLDDRIRIRTKQDQVLALAEAQNVDDRLAISGEFAGSPTIMELRSAIFPEWEAALDHAIWLLESGR